ncbi:MAG: CgeB family protein [Chloroflexota bacterium]
MRITFFGSSITSAYWNGAATYYRGICQALHRRGHQPVFVEQDIYQRQQHRDLERDPDYAEVIVCRDLPELERELRRARGSDLVVKCSGVGRHDELLDEAVLSARTESNRVVYWDVDAPFTLDQAFQSADWYFRRLVPDYDAVLTYGGGPKVAEGYRALGARSVELVYNALDPETHHPVPPDPKYRCDLLFVGNRLPDREARVRHFFLGAAEQCPDHQFLLGGEGWGDLPLPANVRYLGHVPTARHNVLNCSARLVLNINRQAMADYGYSPPTRVFEAAGAGACLVTDSWRGIESFLSPGEELLVASGPEEIALLLRSVAPEQAAAMGEAARRRVLAHHSYDLRGAQLQAFFQRLYRE